MDSLVTGKPEAGGKKSAGRSRRCGRREPLRALHLALAAAPSLDRSCMLTGHRRSCISAYAESSTTDSAGSSKNTKDKGSNGKTTTPSPLIIVNSIDSAQKTKLGNYATRNASAICRPESAPKCRRAISLVE